MRALCLVSLGLALIVIPGCERTTNAPPPPATHETSPYSPIPVAAEDEPGAPRQVRCQVGAGPEQDCTLTPLFGDESFQLDGEGVALRMVVTGNEGGLFVVISPERRVPAGGVYRRSSASDACWADEQGASDQSPICIR